MTSNGGCSHLYNSQRKIIWRWREHKCECHECEARRRYRRKLYRIHKDRERERMNAIRSGR